MKVHFERHFFFFQISSVKSKVSVFHIHQKKRASRCLLQPLDGTLTPWISQSPAATAEGQNRELGSLAATSM